MPFHNNQFIPSSGPDREELRDKGQFWTPSWVANAMVSYVLKGKTDHIFDPAVGAGVFFQSANAISKELNRPIKLLGTEIDPEIINQGFNFGLTNEDFRLVEIRDFILNPPNKCFDAIVANPPYIRHHRLSSEYKEQFLEIACKTIGHKIDGRAGLHTYFLIQALRMLNPNGRLSFIMPSDICEGIFAETLWKWISSNYSLDAVMTFDKDATPFPAVDTNAIVFFIRNAMPQEEIIWAKCLKPNSIQFKEWVDSSFEQTNLSEILIHKRKLTEALLTGLTRPPRTLDKEEIPLINFATTSRGIASGDNDYFLFNSQRVIETKIPADFFVTVISKTRDVQGNCLTDTMIEQLDQKKVATRLLSLDNRPFKEFPKSVQDYILYGEELGLPKRALISQRKPWYKMETRKVPPILFAYLGRRNCRFILNEAKVLPLTGFLCVYPKFEYSDFVINLISALNHPETIENLRLIGKSYGSGAIKVEPRALEKLPIPISILSKFNLKSLVQNNFLENFHNINSG